MHRAVRPRARRASKAQRWAAAFSSGSAEGLMWMTTTRHWMVEQESKKRPMSPPGILASAI
eukprot:5570092-Alexandrium_andersonii.AAC.1